MASTLSGVIAAFDITNFGPSVSPVILTHCFSGDVPSCSAAVTPVDDAAVSPVASSFIDRQAQLQGAKGVPSSGSISSYTSTFSVLVGPSLQLSVTHADPWTQGQTGAAYTIAVSNAATAGPTAGIVTVTETLPAGLTLTSMSGTGWTCSANTCTRSDVLPAGAAYPAITAAVNVAANAASPLLNSVTVSGGGSAPAAVSDPTTVVARPVLSIGNSHTGNFTQGQAGAAYTLVVSNAAAAGPTSGSVTVTDTLPAGLSLVSMAGTGWTCLANSCSRADALAPGAAYPAIAVTVNVAANAASPLVNTAAVSGGNSAPASAADSTLIAANLSSLSIVKTHPGSFAQGQKSALYTVIVSNAAGAAPTSGTVTVTESLPAGLSLVSMSGSGWSCSAAVCSRTDALAAGASYPSIAVQVNVATNAASPQVNAVTVSGGGSPAAGASDSTVVTLGAPVLGIVKSHAGNFRQGQAGAVYSVAVSNAAGAPPTNSTVTVTDTLPAGLSLVSMTGTGWSCGGNSCKRSDALAGGASYPPIVVTVNVASNAAASLVNTAAVSGGGSANATASDPTTVGVPAGAAALSIAESHLGNFTQGQSGAVYTILVSNAAAAGATSGTVTVTDTLPTGLSLVSMTGPGWTCSAATCTRADALAPGSSYSPITLTVNVAANAPSPLVNTAAVSGGGSAPAAASDSAVIGINSTALLSVASSHLGNFTQGQANATYAISVSNAAGASSTAGAVTVTDSIPAGLTLISMAGSGWTCTGASCTRADSLAAGAAWPAITVTVNVASNAGSPLVNAVTVSGGNSPSAAASDTTIVFAKAPVLSVVSSHTGNFAHGQTGAVYTLVVANALLAPPTNSSVSVTDVVPSGMTLVSMAGAGWTCSGNTCKRADALAAGATYPAITVTVNVSTSAVSPAVNSASVSGGGSNSATASDPTVIAP
jgi:uncharacterized repeat protein (TIGR01451 family)